MSPKQAQTTRRAFAFSQVPLCITRGRVPYWTRDLPESKTLYLKYNKCRDQPSFAKMMKQVWAAVDGLTKKGKPLDRLVIDLRHNGGGDSRVMNPLFDALRKRTGYRGENLVVIIGRHTFSSALLNAMTLRKEFNARLVGGIDGRQTKPLW